MKNKEIEELLNYMKQYVENKYEHDSEPMLNYKDLQIVLSYIEQLQSLCNKYEQEHKTTFEIWEKDIEKLKQLENNRDKALKIIDSYELGKYDYSIPPGGIIELREALKGDSE